MSGLVLPSNPAWFFHRVGGARRLGVVTPERGGRFVDAGPADALELLARGALDADDLRERLGSGAVLDREPTFDVPVDRPSKILGLGKNFAAHAAEFGAEVPEEPIFFAKLADSLLPHGGTVLLPHWVDSRIDHEIELGVVLGFPDPERRGRRDVAAADALRLVAGFTIVNDVTARRIQGDDRGQQRPWLRSKSFDTFCPVGPWVVPRESLPGHANLELWLEVDGERRQHSRTSKMVVDVAQALEYLSRHTTLRPGDLIAMGTPEGVGPIRAGNVMVGAIEGIGRLVNPVGRATPASRA